MGLVKNILYQLSNKKFVSFFDKQTIYPYYHLVSDEIVPHIDNLYRFKNKNQFIKDIDFLIANYQALNPIDLLLNKKSKNKFLITFDDGLQEIYSVIYPILKERNISAIFFINPNFVDNNDGLYKHYSSIIINDLKKNNFQENVLDKISEICEFSYSNISDFESKLIKIKYSERHKIKLVLKLLNFNINEYLRIQKPYITKSQIHEMINDGFYFGGHTMSHPPLQLLSLKEQESEIINSINWLKFNFGIDYSFFAFPFSDKAISTKLVEKLFEYDKNIFIFGNSGLKKDIDERIIQRFSLENPNKTIEKQIVTENFYKYYNKLTGRYNISRQ